MDAFLTNDNNYASMVSRSPSNFIPNFLKRDDVFLPQTASEFRNMLKTHLRVETLAESFRQRLNSIPGYNVFEAFSSLDLSENGSINAQDLRKMFESRGFFVPIKEVQQVI